MEQELVCQAAALPAHTDAVGSLLRSAGVDSRDKLRLAALYGLRYERDGKRNTEELLRTLEVRGHARRSGAYYTRGEGPGQRGTSGGRAILGGGCAACMWLGLQGRCGWGRDGWGCV